MHAEAPATLIAGSHGGIGQALLQTQLQRGPVISISRQPQPAQLTPPAGHVWQHIQADLSDPASVAAVQTQLAEQPIARVFACSGILHDAQHQPEKSLSQLHSEWLLTSMRSNVLSHVHLAQALSKQVSKRSPVHWLSLSAKVGSIEDNGLGGWYSYRMSKAALNMWIKNLSIEWQRKSPDSIVAAVHPGTTDTELSKPFQSRLAQDQLYSAELTAQRLSRVMDELSPAQHGKLLFWDGSILPW
ncbi:cell-cell signaling protein CsgA [Bacterioplanes sanyensis]|uniref:Cell-cell signaling protein CsgA n=1 Tax=Bacterioplanes sanyensis TaxID=1249553 RepID=A0A222FP24_9GAMM|nr:SDR family NAD(P)-dependent oxidoreductase [Bacterioplanes sanyensis]ASP40286.1 cell-cell signaling protein CsgA [Bacterioplanes sanyensis]